MNFRALKILLLLLLPIATLSKAFAQEKDNIFTVNLGSTTRYAIINKTAKLVKILKYDTFKDSIDNLTIVSYKEKVGYIDKSGKEIIPLRYDFGYDFEDGVAIVGFDKMEQSGDISFNSKRYGIINKSGKVIVPIEFAKIEHFSVGLALVQKSIFGTDPFFVDKTGKTIISGYNSASSFSEGLACVGKKEENPLYKESEKAKPQPKAKQFTGGFEISVASISLHDSKYLIRYGFIDKNNQIIIPFEYEDAGDFSEGMAFVKRNGKYGFIDKTGKEVIPFEYDKANNFEKGLAVVERGGKTGVINKEGKIIVPIEYSKVRLMSETLIAVVDRDLGLFSRDGIQILAPNSNISRINLPSERVYLIVSRKPFENNTYGYVNENGEIISEQIFLKAENFKEDMALVMPIKDKESEDEEGFRFQDPKYGFINRKGEMVIDATYDIAESFSEGLAKIGVNPYYGEVKYGFINQKGEVVVDPIYSEASNFSEGLAVVKGEEGKCGYINKEGTIVIPMKYKASLKFKNGLALVKDLEDNLLAIDKEGNEYTVTFVL